MRLNVARLGGGLVIAGCVAFLVAEAMILGGRGGGPGLRSLDRVAVALALLMGGVGGAVLAVAGEGPLAGRRPRAGVATLALAAFGFLGFLLLPQDDIGLLYAYLLLGVVLGLAGIIGILLLGTALLRADGAGRLAGRMLLGGIALVPIIFLLGALSEPTGLQLGTLTGPIGIVAILLLVGGIGTVGYVAVSDRWSWR